MACFGGRLGYAGSMKNNNRAEALLYRLHNSGRFVSVARMQRVARLAVLGGSSAVVVLNYCNGNSNGR